MTWLVVVSIVLAVLVTGSGVLVMWIARSAANGGVGVNAVAGIRTSATTATDETWRLAHEVGEKPTWWGGVVFAIGGVLAGVNALLLVGGLVDEATGSTILGVAMGVATVGGTGLVSYGGVRGHRTAKELLESEV